MNLSQQNTQRVIDGALIDTVLNVLSSVALPLLPAARSANMRDTERVIGEGKIIGGIGSVIKTIGSLLF